MNYRMQICQSIGEIAQADWNSLLRKCNGGVLHPALRHEYLLALEASGSATAETGWGPLHLAIRSDAGALLAAMPLYLKSHSYGEYVFDWAWAQAYERSGQRYYPKLLCAIPFTPVLAPKILHSTPEAGEALAQGLAQLTWQAAENTELLGTRISTLHALFLTEQDQQLLLGEATSLNNGSRHVVQFHWHNQSPASGKKFHNFDEFLDNLNQKKRKNIRAERRKAHMKGLEIRRINGSEVSETELEFFYQCYSRTYMEHFSSPYLNLEFFKQICTTMGEQVLLIQASLHGQAVASSFFLTSEERLYGRYWGCIENLPCLHFELCYYQAIEFAIERGIEWFEGGAQGEHKMARGLNPQTMVSAHYVHDNGFKLPIENFLRREKAHLQAYAVELNEHTAFRESKNSQL
ncbi:MAG: GNAT family N-acetyltransferase [Burkholderiales bacterium]|jgi:predicted N-acyltransferase|uniref:GNAT family N-acetyltransferase n=1 Tax=Limnobacter sp. TaxID=2003368 RepID=UPI0039BC286D|nr:GNAT family N-acetyltransferase [Burkholderiales bacterium]